MRPAVLVIDIILDFTTGRHGSSEARAIRPALARLLSAARRAKVPILYCQDSHSPTDPELKVWGPHGLFGTPGARTDPALAPKKGEPVIPKHTFSAFFGTDLGETRCVFVYPHDMHRQCLFVLQTGRIPDPENKTSWLW